jgi:hypothetical protein
MSVELENKIKALEQQNEFLKNQLSYYEQDGTTKLYFSLQRKANEMAELLNRTNLVNVELIDPKDKSFERLQKLWADAGTITASIKALEVLAGIGQELTESKKEVVQVNRKPFSPENMADAVGELAGKKI